MSKMVQNWRKKLWVSDKAAIIAIFAKKRRCLKLIEVEMSKDIREYKPKIIGPFTSRQTVCILISLSFVIPILFFVHGISLEIRMLIAAFLAFPVMACGWCEPYGIPLEKFVWLVIKTMLFTPTVRKYKEHNFYAEMFQEKQVKKKKIVRPKTYTGIK